MQASERYTNGARAVMADEADPEVLLKAERRQFSGECTGGAIHSLRLISSPPRLWGMRHAPPHSAAPGRFTPTPVGNA